MTPDDVVVCWPDAGQIGKAVFVASALEGDDAIEVIQGRDGTRSRAYAFLALAHEFPTVPRATLGRKLGKEKCATAARAALLNRGWPWFDLGRLNAVRAACGWSDMTMQEAVAAPLLYCGRSWEEFVDRSAEDARLSYSEAGSSVDAGPAREEAPAPIEARGVESANVAASEACANAEAGSGDENEPAQIQSSITVENSPAAVCSDVGRLNREKGVGAGDCAEKAPAIVGEAGGEHPQPGAGDGDASRPDVPFHPEAAAMLARVERRKAWLAGEPPVVAEVEAPRPPASVEIDVDTPVEPISVSLEAVETAIADLPLLPPKATPAPAPAPFTPSPRAAALAQAALAQAARSMGASKPASALRPQSPGSIGAHVRRVTVDRFAAGGARNQAPKPNEIADTRPVRSDLSAFRAASLSAGSSLSYRADPPAEQRGMVNVTAELMGDPTPQQRARMQQNPGVDVSKYIGGADLG